MGISELVDVKGLAAVETSAEEIVAQGRDLSTVVGDADTLSWIESAPDSDQAVTRLGHWLSARLGVFFFEVADYDRMSDTGGHDGTLVPVFAHGPGAQRFAGVLDNTEVPVRIAEALGLDFRPGARP